MVSDRAGGQGGQDIYVAHRASINDPWGPLQNIGPKINSTANDYCPFVTPDGSKLLFLSNRAGGPGLGDFYMATRTNTADDFAWDNVQLVPELSTPSDEFGPSGFEDPITGAFTLFFNSDRPGGLGGTDVYTTQLGADGKFTPPQLVPELSSPSNDSWPVVRPDGLELVLISNRTGTLGGNDIWISERGSVSEPWSTPVNLGPTVNTSSNEGRAWLYANGSRILFFSNRPGGQGGNDLYETTRTRSTLIPVAGSVTGFGGVTYKTFLQITNPTGSPISGSIIFRPAGQQSSTSDPRMTYTLAPFETRTLSDVMSSIGATGLGSLEIAPSSGAAPAVIARIQDGGVVAVPAITSDNVISSGTRAVLTTPADLTQSRMNVGIRTLAVGATITATLYDAGGAQLRSASRTLPANTLVQMSAPDLVGGDIGANQTIVISVDTGSAVIYGSTTGGTPMLQLAARVGG